MEILRVRNTMLQSGLEGIPYIIQIHRDGLVAMVYIALMQLISKN